MKTSERYHTPDGYRYLFLLSRETLLKTAKCLPSTIGSDSCILNVDDVEVFFVGTDDLYPRLSISGKSLTVKLNPNDARNLSTNLEWLSKAECSEPDVSQPHYHFDCNFWDETRREYINKDVVFELIYDVEEDESNISSI